MCVCPCLCIKVSENWGKDYILLLSIVPLATL